MKKYIINTHYLFLFLLIFASSAKAQDVENEFQSRTSVSLSTKLMKNLKLSFNPELRFDDSFSIDKTVLEGAASYKLFKNFSLGAGYRFYSNKRETKSTEYYSRYAFNLKYKKSFNRFKPSLKISYANFSNDSESDVMRYKAAVQYDIKKSKFTPYAGVEAFQKISGSDLEKMRYFIGTDYKICKKNYININYKFDYFQNEYKNKHIVSIGYKLKF